MILLINFHFFKNTLVSDIKYMNNLYYIFIIIFNITKFNYFSYKIISYHAKID